MKTFEEVKKDITYFKSILKGNFVKKTANFIARVNASSSYITGSISWLQKYKELKECACELYMELKAEHYQFTPEESSIFEKRYFDVASNSTSQERRKNIVDTMMADSIAAGKVEFGSSEMFMQRVQAEVACGLITEEQARAKIESNQKLFAAVNKMTEFGGDTITTGTLDTDGNTIPKAADDTNSIHPEPVKEVEPIVITSVMLNDKLNAIHGSKLNIKEKLESILKLYDCAKDGIREADCSLSDEVSAKCHNLSLSEKELVDNYNVVHNILIPSATYKSGLFDAAGLKVDKSVWDNIYIENTTPSKENTPTVTTEDTTPTAPKEVGEFIVTNRMVYLKLDEINKINDGLQKHIACKKLLTIVSESCNKDGISCVNLINKTLGNWQTNKNITIAEMYNNTYQIVSKLVPNSNEEMDKPSPIKATRDVWDSIGYIK